jgi:hypothetical protein
VTAKQLLDELHTTTDARVVWLGGRLQLLGDTSRVSQDLRARLRAARAALEFELRPKPCSLCGRFGFREAQAVCFWCRGRQAIGDHSKSSSGEGSSR